MIENSETTNLTDLYRFAIGVKNQSYYLDKFKKFDEMGREWAISWNWAAFFFTGIWFLYRKMYLWFFIFLIAVIALNFAVILSPISGILYLVPCFFFAIFGNTLYHQKIKTHIDNTLNSNISWSISKVTDIVTENGGIHAWVPYVLGTVPVLGIAAAIAIPAFQKQKFLDEKQTSIEANFANKAITPTSKDQVQEIEKSTADEKPQKNKPKQTTFNANNPNQQRKSIEAEFKLLNLFRLTNSIEDNTMPESILIKIKLEDCLNFEGEQGQRVLDIITDKRDSYIRKGIKPIDALRNSVWDSVPSCLL